MTDTRHDVTLALCADLLFAARIRGVAGQVGAQVETLTARADVLARVRERPPARLLLDLDARWVDGLALVRSLKADAALARIPIIAFVSHVRTEAIQAARDAGADRVLARSAFVRELPSLLGGGSAG